MDKILEKELMNKIHEANYEMLNYIKEICKANDIDMYLWGGSLLGAVRHNSFIPWDDDVDIVMFRKDYDRLVEAIRDNPDDRFKLLEVYSQENFVTFIPMLLYCDSRIRGEGEESFLPNHLHLDIFLLDKTSDRKLLRIIHGYLLLLIYGLAMGHRKSKQISERFEYTGVQRIVSRILSIFGRAFSFKTIKKWHVKISRIYELCDTQYVFCTNNAPTCLSEKHSHVASVYNEVLYSPFYEDVMPIPAGYDIILKSGYGDYMKLPPEEKRIPDHVLLQQVKVKGYSGQQNA